ncbi:MAG: hypothetical protein Q9206_000228 [Seirophora lacunosa]
MNGADSAKGYCGTTTEYCADPDCQFGFGTCDSSHTPVNPTTLYDPRPQLGQVSYDNDIYACTKERVVALTYDDGPYNFTDQLLNELAKYGFKATFFITGNNLHKGPIDETDAWRNIIQRMDREGHQIASHTWSHYNLSRISSDERKQQMVKNERAIANIIGKYPTYMRPPYSQCSQASGCWTDMKALGYHRVYFDLDTQDYLNPNSIQISKSIVAQILDRGGATDYLAIQHDLVQQSVVNLSPDFFARIKAKGWKGVTAGECLDDNPANWYRIPGRSTFSDSISCIMDAFRRMAAVAGLSLVYRVAAHEHHDDKIPEGEAVSPDPITVGALLAILGYFLGHAHKGRQFAPNIHASFATVLMLLLTVQIIFGVYLKFHLERGIHGRIRRYFVFSHGVIGKVMPVISWVQMLFGGITALGFCRDDHLGQCLAHFIMGSAFIGYGIVLTILLLVGQAWLRNTGRSQEFFDSLLIAAWGCVNTFTEHRWGGPWVRNDLQHTSMGIVWWCAGLLGVWLSRKRDGRPKRNLIPAMVILITGWAMSAHPQGLELSTHVHTVFGYTLMAAGASRIVEIAFVLRDRGSVDDEGKGDEASSWQYLTPFVSSPIAVRLSGFLSMGMTYADLMQLLYASGFLFMGATEEQMALLSNAHVSHVSYILILYSISFLLFLFVAMLLHLYASHAWPLEPASTKGEMAGANGAPRMNGHIERRMKDAEEFELEGLMSDDDDNGVSGIERTISPSQMDGKIRWDPEITPVVATRCAFNVDARAKYRYPSRRIILVLWDLNRGQHATAQGEDDFRHVANNTN